MLQLILLTISHGVRPIVAMAEEDGTMMRVITQDLEVITLTPAG